MKLVHGLALCLSAFLPFCLGQTYIREALKLAGQVAQVHLRFQRHGVRRVVVHEVGELGGGAVQRRV